MAHGQGDSEPNLHLVENALPSLVWRQAGRIFHSVCLRRSLAASRSR